MSRSKNIKIFLASSNELKGDRNAFGNFVRQIDNLYEKRGIRIKLFEWEDADAAYNGQRKQDEYNDEVRASDMFLALFYKKAGKYTIEEFDVAVDEFNRTKTKPKCYVYCRELLDGEKETTELSNFKNRLSNEMEYFRCNYNNVDTLQLHFLMQLLLVENNQLDELQVVDGDVILYGTIVAKMENLRFAIKNNDYQRMKQRLVELLAMINEAGLRIEEHPDGEDLCIENQRLLNERNNLQKEFKQQQKLLLDIAKRITQLHRGQISDQMHSAIEAFNNGDANKARIILDEAEEEGDNRFSEFERKEEIRKKEIQNIEKDIDNLLLQATTVMVDIGNPIQKRICKSVELYKKADYRASRIDYDKEKYSEMLCMYACFLYKYGLYHDSEAVWLRQISMVEELYGTENEISAKSYNYIGLVYWAQANYVKALNYYYKALQIYEKILGKESLRAATCYNNIGVVYEYQDKYNKALEYYSKALEIREMVLGKNHLDTAQTYNNIGMMYYKQGKYHDALKYCYKALRTKEKVLGENHIDTALSYNNIGGIYDNQINFHKALEYYCKALEIRINQLGAYHPDTACSYNNIGFFCFRAKEYEMALKFLDKALKIRNKMLGLNHPDTKNTQELIEAVKMAIMKG